MKQEGIDELTSSFDQVRERIENDGDIKVRISFSSTERDTLWTVRHVYGWQFSDGELLDLGPHSIVRKEVVEPGLMAIRDNGECANAPRSLAVSYGQCVSTRETGSHQCNFPA